MIKFFKKWMLWLFVGGIVLAAPVIPQGNGLISVAVFENNTTGEELRLQMNDDVYDSMGEKGGWQYNPTKDGYTFKAAYQYPVGAYKKVLVKATATTTKVMNSAPEYADRDDFINLLEILIPKVEAAIAFNDSDQFFDGAATSFTISHTAAGSNRIAIMMALTSTGDINNTPTVDGNNATLVRTFDYVGGGGDQVIYMWYYIAPPAQAVNYVLTSGSSADNDWQVSTYSGAAQTGQVDSDNQGQGATELTLSTTVVADNSWLVSGARGYNTGNAAPGTGTTGRESGAYFDSGDSNGTVGTGAQTMGWTSTSGNLAGIIASIAPAAVEAEVEEVSNSQIYLIGI